MTPNIPPSAAPQSEVPQAEVVYGSNNFQVSLLCLHPGETWPAYPQAPVKEAQLFVVDGPLTMLSPNGEKTDITKGQRLEALKKHPRTLTNSTGNPITLVSVAWGDDFQPCPLQEVTETRPWGSFTVLKDEPDYKLKQLAVNPGNRLSLQRHEKREEHWLVTAGHPEVTLDDELVRLSPGDYIRIPRHSWHRISNPAENNSPENNSLVEIIELQLGDYFGEDDIERRQDDYGRS